MSAGADLAIFKWAGGKSWLIPTIDSLVNPASFQGYVEPFVGGAAIFRWFRSKSMAPALLSDVNHRLIRAYRAIAQDPGGVTTQYETERGRYNAATYEERSAMYYRWRDQLNSAAPPPAMMLLCNRAGFRGMFRENRKGEFNVPWGEYASLPSLAETIWTYSRLFQNATLRACDWSAHPDWWNRETLVFLDPPYSGTFTSYAAGAWSKPDDDRLADEVKRAAGEGTRILLTLPDNEHGRALVERATGDVKPRVLEVSKSGVISVGKRKRQHELLVMFNLGGA